MSKRTLYRENHKNKLQNKTSKTAAEKMFDFLLKNKGETFSRKELAEKIGVKPPTISRAYNELQNETFGKSKKYKVFRVDNKYQVNNLEFSHNNKKEEKSITNIEKEARTIANPQIWLSKYAEPITSTVILYRINPYFRLKVKESLLKLFENDIYTIIERKDELFIILKENKNRSKTSEEICELYFTAVDLSKGN